MATQKRRVIYMSDKDWRTLTEKAELRELSISAYIRASIPAIGGGFITPDALLKDPAFAAFRPVPKPGRK